MYFKEDEVNEYLKTNDLECKHCGEIVRSLDQICSLFSKIHCEAELKAKDVKTFLEAMK